MKPLESIVEMTNRLNALLTTLMKLGKYFSKKEVNNKILRILPKKDWESRVTLIEEAQDLANLPTDVLIGKLLTHELSIKQRDEELVEKEDKRKAIALKASQEDSDEDSNEESCDDEIAMLTKNFNRFLKRKFPSKLKTFNKKYEGEGKMKIKEVNCYECKKPGHIKSECPKLRHKSKGAKERRKAFKATWDDASKSEVEEDQDEVANLCFMAFEDDIEVPSSSNSSFNFNNDLYIVIVSR